MIRAAAALKIAHDLLDPYAQVGGVSPDQIKRAARLIQLAVEQDELEVEIARLEAQRVPA